MVLGPVGVQSAYHPDEDTGVAEACADLVVPYTFSSAATRTIEEVSQTSGDGLRWFQLYWPVNEEITASLLTLARAVGYKVLFATLDTATMYWCPADLDLGYQPMVMGTCNAATFSDPIFRRKFAERSDGGTGTAPPVLKGIRHVGHARTALEHGVQGIVVSNHGTRQVDGAVGALEVLPEILDAVRDRMTVPFDSGIRTGSDIMKILCLDAKAVLVARPAMHGPGNPWGGGGALGHVMASLLAKLDGAMGLAGIKSIADLDRSIVRRVVYGGDILSNL
ncbi:hypothetical protein DL764_002889 [Monosporascus ibericus]|uniref:FMN hydroxy acid dehydrogenase domain-containing protein n=1 Tax=Monosporascus ibericus TaxID=155417 RepID=A0A4Q4TIL1_9PEZI|nr:hypothetical protein DL764_002889 [Monosporascus ibericus]